MKFGNLVLFGKHPAWSDHMFVGENEAGARELKSQFYDRSVIEALQGADAEDLRLESRCFLVWIRAKLFCIASISSWDSVGRRRFPLFGALEIQGGNVGLDASSDELPHLRDRLFDFMRALQVSPLSEDPAAWRKDVIAAVESFDAQLAESSSEVSQSNGGSVSDVALEGPTVRALMTCLHEGKRAVDLDNCDFPRACGLACAGLVQFRSPASVVVPFDSALRGEALLFAEHSGSFPFGGWMAGRMGKLSLSLSQVSPDVIRLLGGAEASDQRLTVRSIPSLRIGAGACGGRLRFFRNPLVLGVLLALLLSVLLGVFLSGGGDKISEESAVRVEKTDPAHMRWSENARAYVDWVKPFQDYFAETETESSAAASLKAVLAKEFNPFSVVNEGRVRMDLINNPLKRTFLPSNQPKLTEIYDRIESLKQNLALHFEERYGFFDLSEFVVSGYRFPEFLEVQESGNLSITPDFSERLVDQIKHLERCRPVLQELTSILTRVDRVVASIDAVSVEHGDALRGGLHGYFVSAGNLEAIRNYILSLERLIERFEAVRFSEVARDLLSEDPDWKALSQDGDNPELPVHFVALLTDYQTVPKEKTSEIYEEVRTEVESVRQRLRELTTNFSDAAIEARAIDLELDAVLDAFAAVKDGAEIERTRIAMQKIAVGERARLTGLALKADALYARYADPSVWISQFEPVLQQFESVHLRSLTRKRLEDLRASATADTVNLAAAYASFHGASEALLDVLRRLDFSAGLGKSTAVKSYLENGGARDSIVLYVLSHLREPLSKSASLEVIEATAVRVEAQVEELATSFSDHSVRLRRIYGEMATTEGALSALRSAIEALYAHPLYSGGEWDSLGFLVKADFQEVLAHVTSEEAVFWYLGVTSESGNLNRFVFSSIATAWDSLPSPISAVVVERLTSSFFQFSKELFKRDLPEFLAVYANLENFLPLDLASPDDLALREISRFHLNLTEGGSGVDLSREELERLSEAASHELVEAYYSAFAEGFDEAGAGAEELRRMTTQAPLLLDVVSDSDPDFIEFVVAGGHRLKFLPLNTDEGKIYVQQRPLFLQELIGLLTAADSGAADRLFRMAALWPRSFSPTAQGTGFSPLSKWEFESGDSFAALHAFSRDATPAYVSEPADAKILADKMGMRFFRPNEVQPFIAVGGGRPRAPIDLTESQRSQLDTLGSVETSVYAEVIRQQIKAGRWAGGLDFEREILWDDGFINVVGGSAELVYDGRSFFAFGGSWLCLPDRPEAIIPILDPKKMYLDLGIRFVFDAPARTFSEISNDAVLAAVARRLQ